MSLNYKELINNPNKIVKDIEVDGEVIKDVSFDNFSELYNAKSKLSIWDHITMTFWQIRNWFKDTYYEIKYGFQRMFRKYDSTETFGLYYNFIERYSAILKDYRNHHWGYPGNLTAEEWDAIVDKMIHCLYMMNEENVEKELSKDMPEHWVPNAITVYEIMERYKTEFFELFSKYFYNLWD